jgi:beta-fructofuranosidase
LTQWSFLGALWEPKANTSVGPVLSTGSFGFNFEVSGFFPLYDRAGKAHWYANMGTEGANVSFHSSAQWALWAEGTVTQRKNGTNISAEFHPRSGGAGDWGNAYALTSFNDTKHNRRVQWGWSREDILGAAPAAGSGLFSAPQQGFQGSLTLPRELFVHEVDNVVNTSALVESKNAVLVGTNRSGVVTAQTLGVRPLPDVVAGLRVNAIHQRYPCTQRFNRTTILAPRGAAQMELRATFAAPVSSNSSSSGGGCGVGVILAASPDHREYTTIHYQPSNHTLLVTRAKSSLLGGTSGFNTETVTGFFLPYTLSNSSSNNNNNGQRQTVEEDIDMQIFLDGSLLEVYVNDRFALSTRIYPSMRCSTGFGVFVGGGAGGAGGAGNSSSSSGNGANVKRFEAWLGLADVWGGRPRNSSSPLVYDFPEETNGGVWWPGV